MTMIDAARTTGGPQTAGPLGIPADGTWQPVGVHDAAVMLDRIARFCEVSCDPGPTACPGPDCPLWHVERAAAEYLEQRWVDAQD